MRVINSGKDFMVTLANGIEAKKWITENIYESNKSAIVPNGKEITGDIKPNIPTRKLKNIVRGIMGKIKIFAGKETRDRMPVE